MMNKDEYSYILMIYDIIVCHLSARKLCSFCAFCLFLYVICSVVVCCLYVCSFVYLSATIMVNKDEYIMCPVSYSVGRSASKPKTLDVSHLGRIVR